MSQSLMKVFVHLTFHIRTDSPGIRREDRNDMWAYLSGTARAFGSICVATGGTKDHVHILCTLPRDISAADFVKRLKTSSTRWLKEQEPVRYANFHWQGGYGMFSVSHSNVMATKEYVNNQEQHHRTETTRDEYIRILRGYGVEYDAKYLFTN